MVSVKDITKSFDLSKKQMKMNGTRNKKKIAVSNVSFNAVPGEIYGLLGPNGAGKTTSFYMIVGLIKPNAIDLSPTSHRHRL